VSQEGTPNKNPGADVDTSTPENYSNAAPVKDENFERQKAETERKHENVLDNQSVTSEKSNLVETGQITLESSRGKSVSQSVSQSSSQSVSQSINPLIKKS